MRHPMYENETYTMMFTNACTGELAISKLAALCFETE